MSNLLERAIVDAAALKDAALKNAEQLVIEKYSKEIKQAMNRLLEEAPEDDLGMGDLDLDATGMGDELAMEPTIEEEELATDELEAFSPDSIEAQVPDAFTSDDDQVVRIKLDSLYADIPEEEDGPFAGDDELANDEISINIEDEEDTELDLDTEIDLGTVEDDVAPSPDADIGVDISSDLVAEALAELGIDEEEIDLEEVMEAVRVDFEPQKSGWAGTPETIMKEYEAMLLAREQDTKVKEENEELRKTVAKLQKENKTLASAATKLQQQNEDFDATFIALQEKLETMNVSNAKLLYINQALENASLNERQKRRIVEAISKADTVQEAKIVFDTLNNTVASSSDVKKDVTLSEMISKKSSLLVAARKEQPKQDANPVFNRMQTLAGIKTR